MWDRDRSWAWFSPQLDRPCQILGPSAVMVTVGVWAGGEVYPQPHQLHPGLHLLWTPTIYYHHPQVSELVVNGGWTWGNSFWTFQWCKSSGRTGSVLFTRCRTTVEHPRSNSCTTQCRHTTVSCSSNLSCVLSLVSAYGKTWMESLQKLSASLVFRRQVYVSRLSGTCLCELTLWHTPFAT